LSEEDVDSYRDCGKEGIAVNGANEGHGDLSSKFERELVEAATVGGCKSAHQAGEVKSVVAGGTDPVLGLQQAASLDAQASPDQVMDGIPEQIFGPRWQEVRLLDGLSKEELEVWTDSAEVGCGGKGEVELEATGQEQHSVDRLAGGKIKKFVGGKLCH
jgi:hypothetical protein